jgi:hypothetical protein
MIMIDDAITTVGFALQSYVNTCIHEDTEENRAERVELTLAWSIIKSHLEENDNDSNL